MLVEIGSLYGYFPNGSKTHVLAKPQYAEAAKEIFIETRFDGGREKRSPLCCDLELDEMSTELCTSKSQHHVYQGSKIIPSPASH